jgi:hypothetical protein
MFAQIYGQQTLPHGDEPLMQPMVSGSGLFCAYAPSVPAKSNNSEAMKTNFIGASLIWNAQQ